MTSVMFPPDLDLREVTTSALDRLSEPGPAELRMLLWKALVSRALELKIMELFMEGTLPGTTHMSTGMEGVAVGAVSAMDPGDLIFATYRGHHHAVAAGLEPATLFAEMLGRSSGNCRGMGGSTHAATDPARGLMGTSLVVGASIPIAVGAALGSRLRGDGKVIVCFTGDGSTNNGAFHEGLNMAGLWGVPFVLVVENNQYAEFTATGDGTATRDIFTRAHSYRMDGMSVDGQDAVAVHKAVAEAIAQVRGGGRPVLVEARTYRYKGHSRTDPAKYRSPGEVARWQLNDPIRILTERLAALKDWSAEEEKQMRSAASREIDTAAEFAKAEPVATTEEAKSYVFA